VPLVSFPLLDPSPEEGRSLLRRELLEPQYRSGDPVRAALDWIQRQLDQGLVAAQGAPALSTVVAMVLLVLLVAALALLLSRARRTARVRGSVGDVLGETPTSAAELRARAERLLEQGEPAEALVEAFRALAQRQVEQGRLAEDPGATAREVAVRVADAAPASTAGSDHPGRLAAAAELFDAVLYGGLPAGPEQVREVLSLDAELGGVRR